MTTVAAPPYDLQAEEGILGGLVRDPAAISKVAPWLQPAHFYRDAHRWIYEAILTLYRAHTPADVVTIGHELERRGRLPAADGGALIEHFWSGPYSAANLESYGGIVVRCAAARRRIVIGEQLAALGRQTDLDEEEIARQERALLAQLREDAPGAWVSLAAVWEINRQAMADRIAQGAPGGVPTGFPTLDHHTQGWQPGDLVILGARTSRGKSAMALHWAQAAAKAGYCVGVISLETRKEAMGLRLLARESGVDYGVLRAARLGAHDWTRVDAALDGEAEMAGRVWFLDTPTQTVPQVGAWVDQLRAEAGCDLLIVDYLQLMEAHKRAGNREQEIAAITRGLKLLAMQLNLPIIALAQLSRAALGAEIPGLQHLRESGSQEQDAALVLFLHRPDEQNPQRVDLILAKQREGVADIGIPLYWHGSTQRFEETE